MLLYEDVRLTYAERPVLSLIDHPRKLFGVSGDFYVLKKPALCVKAKKTHILRKNHTKNLDNSN